MHLPIEIKRLCKQAVIPEPATEMSAGVDLRVMLPAKRSLTLAPGDEAMVGTGLAIHINNPGWMAVAVPRSGLGRKGLVLGNLVGVIDADYQGELMLSLWNRGKDTLTIEHGERIAQLLFVPVGIPVFTEVTEFTPTARGEGGFGHSGKI